MGMATPKRTYRKIGIVNQQPPPQTLRASIAFPQPLLHGREPFVQQWRGPFRLFCANFRSRRCVGAQTLRRRVALKVAGVQEAWGSTQCLRLLPYTRRFRIASSMVEHASSPPWTACCQRLRSSMCANLAVDCKREQLPQRGTPLVGSSNSDTLCRHDMVGVMFLGVAAPDARPAE